MRTKIALLTGGQDKPYALGLALSLIAEGMTLDFIGSDFLEVPELLNNSQVRFLNLRGDMRPDAFLPVKVLRVVKYYMRLLWYTVFAEPPIFHILWNNKVEIIDRTLLLLYYRLFRKRLVFTVHNVNAAKRDKNDGFLNRLTLRIQYGLADHLFVHTEKMKQELQVEFAVNASKVSVIPFGINSTVPNTALTSAEARQHLEMASFHKTILFFGNIAPYKGLEYLVEAMVILADALPDCRLVIAGRPKGSEAYWRALAEHVVSLGLQERIVQRIEYVPDAETEVYFKAADVLVLPYTHVFQSGVLFLAYNFGLPVIATDVGSLKEEIVEGQTGLVCKPRDPGDLAGAIQAYFSSEMYRQLPSTRREIRSFAQDRYSWTNVAKIAKTVYRGLLGK